MMRTILVALDASVRAPGVLARAVEVAAKFGADLVPLRAISIPPDFPPAAHLAQGDPLPGHLIDVARREVATLLTSSGGLRGVTVKDTIVRAGQPWRAIVEAAEEVKADLVVLGSHGYHGADRILGTTAGKVANLCRRDVLVVHGRIPAA